MLERNTSKAIVGGVAAGLSEKYDINVYIVRTAFVISFFMFGLGLLAYWMLWSGNPGNDNQIHMNFSS